MTYTDLDRRTMAVLANRANDPNTAAQALYVLQKERTDLKTGQAMPAIAAKPGLFDESQKVIKAATNTLSTDWVSKSKSVAAQVALNNFKAADGSFTNMIDTPVANPFKPAGTPPDMISAEEAQKTAIKTALAESAQQARTNNETFQTTFNREYDMFAKNFVEHPVWKQTLKDGVGALMNPTAMTDPTQRARATASAELFMNLSERNYPYARSLMDKPTADAMDTYRALRLYAKMNPEEAIASTSLAVSMPESDTAISSPTKAKYDALVRTANERLTPEQRDAKKVELDRRKQAFEQGVSDATERYAQRLPGNVNQDAIKAQTDAMKASANYALDLLHKLGVSLGRNLVPYGEAHMQKLPF